MGSHCAFCSICELKTALKNKFFNLKKWKFSEKASEYFHLVDKRKSGVESLSWESDFMKQGKRGFCKVEKAQGSQEDYLELDL